MPYRRHMNSDLMRPARLKFAFDVRKIFKPLQNSKLGNGRCSVGRYRHFFSVKFVAPNRAADNPRVVRQNAVHNRQISSRCNFIFNLRGKA